MNVFDDPNGRYLVLRNEAGQYSLWPATADIPSGWVCVLRESGRQECLDYVNGNWSDLRPASAPRS